MKSMSKWVKASDIAVLQSHKKFFKFIENQGGKNVVTRKYERYVWTLQGEYRGVYLKYETLYVKPTTESMDKIFSNDILNEIIAEHDYVDSLPSNEVKADSSTVHFPWMLNHEGELILKVRVKDVSFLDELKDASTPYGFKEVSNGSSVPLTLNVSTFAYAHFPEHGHVGASLRLVAPARIQ